MTGPSPSKHEYFHVFKTCFDGDGTVIVSCCIPLFNWRRSVPTGAVKNGPFWRWRIRFDGDGPVLTDDGFGGNHALPYLTCDGYPGAWRRVPVANCEEDRMTPALQASLLSRPILTASWHVTRGVARALWWGGHAEWNVPLSGKRPPPER